MVINRRAILALNLSFLNRLHLSEFRQQLLSCRDAVPFYGTSIQYSYVMAPKIC